MALNSNSDFERFPHRYRIVYKDGRRSAPFTPKRGELGKILAAAFPDQGDYEVEFVPAKTGG